MTSVNVFLLENYNRYRTLWAILVAFIPILIAALIAFRPSTISDIEWNESEGKLMDWITTHFGYLVLVIIATIAFFVTQYVRVRGDLENLVEERENQDLKIRALSILPSLDFLFDMKSEVLDLFEKKIVQEVVSSDAYKCDVSEYRTIADADSAIDIISESLRGSLALISQLAFRFGTPSRRGRENRCGASIMLFISRDDLELLPREFLKTPNELDSGKLRFVASDTDVMKLKGLLILHNDLRFIRLGEEALRRANTLGTVPLPELAMPVHSNPEITIPGAPEAIWQDHYSAIRNTNEINHKFSENLGKEVKDDIRYYFDSGGPGVDINSILSIRIGTSDHPLGVINFDSNQVDFLGDREDHYKVFTAFIKPLLIMLRPIVKRYAQLYWRILELQQSKE